MIPVKAVLIESTPGVKGGYINVSRSRKTSFLDVIRAIEGQTTFSLFFGG
ncbi:Rrf2 family transcriptional regulator [Cytobacillus firmus]